MEFNGKNSEQFVHLACKGEQGCVGGGYGCWGQGWSTTIHTHTHTAPRSWNVFTVVSVSVNVWLPLQSSRIPHQGQASCHCTTGICDYTDAEECSAPVFSLALPIFYPLEMIVSRCASLQVSGLDPVAPEVWNFCYLVKRQQ